MKHLRLLVPLAVIGAGLGLAGCSGGSDGNMTSSTPPPSSTTPGSTVTPPAPQATDFTVFVKQQVAATSETSSPVDINSTNFTFEDEDNPAAFDDVLPPQGQ